MQTFAYITKDGKSSEGKGAAFFATHPDDCAANLSSLGTLLAAAWDAAIYYRAAVGACAQLPRIRFFVIAVTQAYLADGELIASDLALAARLGVNVLPVLMTDDLEEALEENEALSPFTALLFSELDATALAAMTEETDAKATDEAEPSLSEAQAFRRRIETLVRNETEPPQGAPVGCGAAGDVPNGLRKVLRRGVSDGPRARLFPFTHRRRARRAPCGVAYRHHLRKR